MGSTDCAVEVLIRGRMVGSPSIGDAVSFDFILFSALLLHFFSCLLLDFKFHWIATITQLIPIYESFIDGKIICGSKAGEGDHSFMLER